MNIQNFESRSPALSRSNSLRVKKSEDLTVPTLARKLSTGTRQLRDHELTYFGISKATSATTPNNSIPKSHTISAFAVPLSSSTANHINTSFTHLASSKSSSVIINSSSSTTASTSSIAKHLTNKTHQPSSTIIINTKPTDSHNKPDLIMHSQKYDQSSAAVELTQSQKKSLIDALDDCLNETNGQEPLYENVFANNTSSNNNNGNKQKYNRKLDLDRDEKILDELTRAADEIMNVSLR